MKLPPTYWSGYYGFIKPAPHSVKKQAKGFMIFYYLKGEKTKLGKKVKVGVQVPVHPHPPYLEMNFIMANIVLTF
jgi:hypothetical protein